MRLEERPVVVTMTQFEASLVLKLLDGGVEPAELEAMADRAARLRSEVWRELRRSGDRTQTLAEVM